LLFCRKELKKINENRLKITIEKKKNALKMKLHLEGELA